MTSRMQSTVKAMGMRAYSKRIVAASSLITLRPAASAWFLEGFDGDALVTHLEDLQLLGAAGRVKDDTVAWSGLHQRARQRRQPADVVAIHIDFVAADDA